MPPKISDIISFFELYFSDIRKQSSWDFSGPQIYTSDREVTCVALSLDTDLNTIRQAINEGCELLITHHPLFFNSSKLLTLYILLLLFTPFNIANFSSSVKDILNL